MKRAIIYARVSTDEQRKNYSIPSQVQECKNLIDRKGYMLVGNRYIDPVTGYDAEEGILAFVDDFSSLEVNRPGLDAAYEYLDRYGYDIVVVYSMDRLDRDPYKLHMHEYGFTKGGASIEYVQTNFEDTPDGQFMKTVISAAAKLDNDWRTERMNRGKRQKARQGLFVAGRAPYGYRIDKTAPGGLAVEKIEAEAVKKIFDEYVHHNLSIYEVLDFMNSNKYRPRYSESWAKSSISNILKNEAYIGRVFYNKHKRLEQDLILRDEEEWIEISVTPIITKELFDQAQEKLAENKRVRRKQPKRFYLLTGIIFCQDCKKAFVGQTKPAGKNRLKEDAQYYRHRVSQGHCRNQTVSARIIEPIIWEKIKELLLDPVSLRKGFEQARERIIRDRVTKIDEQEHLLNIRKKLEIKLKNLNAAYIDPDIHMSKNEYQDQRQSIESALRNTIKAINEIDDMQEEASVNEEFKNLDNFSKAIKERMLSSEWTPTPENIRHILELLHIKIFLSDDRSGIIEGWFDMDDGLLNITY